MKRKSLLLMLLLAFALPWAAKAQQTLPYSYGFENGNLTNAGWTLSNASNSGITSDSDAVQSGSYGFLFNYLDEGAYLMSPILTGGDRGIVLSFYYKVYSSSYVDHFKVGYTTDATVTDPSEFTYGAQVTNGTTSWQEYTATLPAGTVRMAVFYDDGNNDDGWYLFLDDFSFDPVTSCEKPTNLNIAYTEGNPTATVTWSGDARSYNIDINGTVEYDVTSPYTFDVALATTYTVKVQSNCGDELSGWATAGSFTTPCPASYAIPYTYGFESASEMNCWTQEDTELPTGYLYDEGYAHTGNGCYYFSSYNGSTEPQYLISPELSGVVNGVHVEFWYRKGPNGQESFKVGYSTTDNDPDSFTWDDEVTSLTTTYQLYKVNYLAQVKYVAVQYTGEDSYYVFLDDFSFTEVNPCLEPTNIVVSGETTTGATIRWTPGLDETAWDLYVTADATIVPDETTTPTVANVSNNTYTFTTELTPATVYYVYVRSICGEEPSAWTSATVFNTECEAMALPYTYDFNDGELSVCWNIFTTDPTYTGTQFAGLDDTDKAFMFFRGKSDATLALVMPEVDATYPLNGYQITFDAAYYNGNSYSMTNGKLGIGIMTDPTDFSTFTLIEEVTLTEDYSYDGFGTHTVRLNSYTGRGQYIAIQDIHTQNGYVLLDNIAVTVLPACLQPTDLNVEGGRNAVVTWEGEAESFDVAYADVNTADPAENIVDNTTENTFNLGDAVNLTEGDYYVWVRANCGTDGSSDWTGPVSFHVGYCTPNPTNHDGNGITGVSFGTGEYVVTNGDGSASLPASSPYYGDYTSMIGAVQAGVESTIAITTGTGSYPYTFVIWVDLDNSLSFEDSDIVYIGKASSGAGTLEATITVPATQATGDYRMRIYGADSYFSDFYNNGNTDWDADHDPCSSGTWRHANDYTLRVLEAPSCLPAGDVTVAVESSTSAVISWTNNNGEEATYTVMQGETVLTTTAVDSYELTGLTAATSYPAGTYTIISDCDETLVANVPAFSTPCDAIVVTDSWSEGFEDGVLSFCWDQDGDGTWTVGTGDGNTYTAIGAHTGTYNAKITHNTSGNVTKLITPVLDLTSLNSPMLTFWYVNRKWVNDIDGFAVYYRTASDAEWTQIYATEEAHETWTEASYVLPNPSATYQIAFEMTDGYGYGVGIDDVTIAEAPTYTLTIEGVGEENWEGGKSGYYLIASPVNVDLTNHDMTTGDYDLYAFDQTEDDEWRNYEANTFNLEPGKGYLYAHKIGGEFTLAGVPYSGNGTFNLVYDEDAEFAGWNLVGNPWAVKAYPNHAFYTLEGGASVNPTANLANTEINPMTGIFVVAVDEDETVTFSTVNPGSKTANLALNLSNGNGLLDRAIVSFGEGRQLPKFQLNPNHTKVFIPQEGKDYAIVNATEMGEMPVSFKAEKNGSYTLGFNTENVEFSYLHLIDNMTGNDVDLLSTPSYSFEASTTDYTSRFKLVFATGNNGSDDTFAFFSDDSFVVNNEGNATLQVVDVMGRIIKSETINGCANVNVNAAPGVYMLRLVNGENVRTQKVVVR